MQTSDPHILLRKKKKIITLVFRLPPPPFIMITPRYNVTRLLIQKTALLVISIRTSQPMDTDVKLFLKIRDGGVEGYILSRFLRVYIIQVVNS
jgi:hypothetical protein